MLAQQLRRLVALLDAGEHEQDLVGGPERRRRLVRAREDRHLGRAGEVLDLREHHQLLLFGDVLARARDDAGDDDEIVVDLLQGGQVRNGRHDLAEPRGYLLQRMLGEVDAEQLLLPAQQLALAAPPGPVGTGCATISSAMPRLAKSPI